MAGTKNERALFWASGISLLLVLVKAVAYTATGSLLVLGSLFDSAGDAVVSAVNGKVQRLAKTKPDREHPYGHGGFEVVTSLAQGIILSILGIVLIIQSFDQLFLSQKELLKTENMPFGIAVLAFSAVTGLLIQWFLGHQEKRSVAAGERSLSIKADRAHYLSDFWVNGMSAIGLAGVWFTGLAKLDAVFGMVAGVFLLRTSGPVLWASLRDILHYEADPEIQAQITAIANEADPRIMSIHRLRTRHYGPSIIVDFHMKLPAKMRLEEAHGIGERVVAKLRRQLPHIDAIIHLDPDSEPDDDLW